MRKLTILTILLISGIVAFAQNKILVHTSNGTEEYLISENDSLYFDENGTTMYFNIGNALSEYLISTIDSITFEEPGINDSTIYVAFQGETVSVINPLSQAGVTLAIVGADVTVTSTAGIRDLNFQLSGTTSDGMFKIYAEKRFNLILNGVDITNPDGPAINVQANKKVSVHMAEGTLNNLTDGPEYADPPIGPNGEEDQDAAFFSEGELLFLGPGNLNINGFGGNQHGLRSDDEIEIDGGTLTITSAVKDGIHGKDGFYMHGGSVNVSSLGDGIDGDEGHIIITAGTISIESTGDDVKGIQCDSTITFNGGALNMTLAGDQSKGIKCDKDMLLNGGNINIEATGGVVLEASGQGYDPSYCAAIKGETNIFIDGCIINITADGEAGRGLSCNGNIVLESGNLQIECNGDGEKYTNTFGEDDAYHGACIDADGDFTINSGEITVSNSGSGGKGISIDGNLLIGDGTNSPFIDVTTTGQSIEITPGGPGPNNPGDYDESKAVKSDVSVIINSGEIIISSADDGIKSGDVLTINNGTVMINNSKEGLEAPNITINDGEVTVYSSDDGLNATYGNGGGGNDGSLLLITGGYTMLSSTNGDPLDSNGNITISGGTIVVHGPQSSPEVGMDVNGTCIISGGFLVVSGTNSNMTEGPSNSSTQRSVLLRTNQSISANTIFHIEDSNGNNLLTFAPNRQYYSIIFSSDALTSGETYSIYTGGSSTGILLNGLYTGGVYTPGTFRSNFTVSGMAQTIWF
ncbi:MAG: carbohydrate-binding domain-containing protein [Bacteroidales bacterium]|nr:carbohydrate-binding domain-containing protein [Bacteroidales bacterium]